jgi:hypothetical protein
MALSRINVEDLTGDAQALSERQPEARAAEARR